MSVESGADVTERRGEAVLTEAALLGLVGDVARELHPEDAVAGVEWDSLLDEELGLDSLSRVELWQRLEAVFGYAPRQQLLSEARTPLDLWEGMRAAMQERAQGQVSPGKGVAGAPVSPAVGLPVSVTGSFAGRQAPERAATLIEALWWHVEQHGERLHVQLLDGESGESLSYQQLWCDAAEVAWSLRDLGLPKAEAVAMMLPTGLDYLRCFFGILLAGGVPAPLYPPLRVSQVAEHMRRHRHILRNAEAGMLIVPQAGQALGRMLQSLAPSLRRVLTPQGLQRGGGSELADWMQPSAGQLAHLQYTSGSTGDPKGVMLTHANLLTNIRAMGKALGVGVDDRFVSWLPLYHDMGLIGAWLGSLYYGIPLGLMSPLSFLSRPLRWLEELHAFGGSISGGPNFAYELCLRHGGGAHLGNLNLERWRCAFNGAEPVLADTLRRFWQRFAGCGLSAGALMPVYGLAECAVGLTFPVMKRGVRLEQIDGEILETRGEARLVKAGGLELKKTEGRLLEMVSCGVPLLGHEVRVVDGGGRELPQRREGLLQFRGPSASDGYYGNQEATEALRTKDGWWQTGDRGYMAKGEIYVTGREKDMIVRAGRNFHPHVLEAALGKLEGVRKGCVAVFGVLNANSGSERTVAAVETRWRKQQQLAKLRADVLACAVSVWEGGLDEVLLLKPASVLKTSSGKIRRHATRELYLQGRLGKGSWRDWVFWWRKGWRGTAGGMRWLVEWGYGLYGWMLLGFFSPAACLGVLLLPRWQWRYTWIRWMACGLLGMGLVYPRLKGRGYLPKKGAFVLVCNHTSYLDVLVLLATLPQAVRFVAKAELHRHVFTRWFLGRLRTVFVERFDAAKSAHDFTQLAEAGDEGCGLVVFPEGTFTRQAGLRSFRLGAFLAASQLDLPLIPATLDGVRDLLREGRWRPQRSPLRLILLKGITAKGKGGWQAAVALSAQARAAMLEELAEPDLG